MKSESEEFCRSKFDQFLREHSAESAIHWKEVAQVSEPPDYYLLLDGLKFAVEATALIDRIDVGTKRPLPFPVIASFLERFVDDVEEIAKRSGILHGTYVVSFFHAVSDFEKFLIAHHIKIDYSGLGYYKGKRPKP